jgi:hypothetical protein
VVEYSGERPTVAVTGQVDRAKATEVSGTVRGLVAVGVRVLTVDLTASWTVPRLLPVLTGPGRHSPPVAGATGGE